LEFFEDNVNTNQDSQRRIGPNAIIQVAHVLTAHLGSETKNHIFTQAGLTQYLDQLPQQMVPETEVIALQTALRATLAFETAATISYEAGLQTGDYLLAHRIPQPAQRILKILPARVACRLLLMAVGKHAWTFSGSGLYEFTVSNPSQVFISHCPICRGATAAQPICHFYTGAFQRLCETLVHRQVKVEETACEAQGAPACVFEIHW
jgi:divinyl protochlorophyllide a 8-vinyl-reductase